MNSEMMQEGMIGRAAMIRFFNCRRCGKCCTEITNIDLVPQDIQKIASFLHENESKIIEQFTVPTTIPGLRRIRDQPCPFYDLEAFGCKIYPARPICCRMYPFLTADAAGQFVNLSHCPSGMEAFVEFMKSDLARTLMVGSPSKTLQKKIFDGSLKDMGLTSSERRKIVKSIGL